jgi:hypothetical protein
MQCPRYRSANNLDLSPDNRSISAVGFLIQQPFMKQNLGLVANG